MTYTTETREQTEAMIMLETFGSTSYPPTRWETKDDDGNELVYKWSESDYTPEWLDRELGLSRGESPDGFVTVLSCSSQPRIPADYRIAYSYQCGEKECPDCEARGHLGTRSFEDAAKELGTKECSLCEGSGHIYWGEEWQVIVFAPRYSYGSGMAGCMYDSGPHAATTKEEAADALVESFGDYLDAIADDAGEGSDIGDGPGAAEAEERDMRAALLKHGRFAFSFPGLAGADYCEIVDGR